MTDSCFLQRSAILALCLLRNADGSIDVNRYLQDKKPIQTYRVGGINLGQVTFEVFHGPVHANSLDQMISVKLIGRFNDQRDRLSIRDLTIFHFRS